MKSWTCVVQRYLRIGFDENFWSTIGSNLGLGFKWTYYVNIPSIFFFISVVMFTHFLFYSCSMIFIFCLKLLFLIAQLICYQLLNFFLSYDFKSVQIRCWILFLCFIFTELRICLWYFLGRIMMYCYSCWCRYGVPS